VLALTVAFTTAALALLAKIASDWMQRHYDRQGIAAALAGEIGAYLNLLKPDNFSNNFEIVGVDVQRSSSRAYAGNSAFADHAPGF
jgi:hypothetical protein